MIKDSLAAPWGKKPAHDGFHAHSAAPTGNPAKSLARRLEPSGARSTSGSCHNCHPQVPRSRIGSLNHGRRQGMLREKKRHGLQNQPDHLFKCSLSVPQPWKTTTPSHASPIMLLRTRYPSIHGTCPPDTTTSCLSKLTFSSFQIPYSLGNLEMRSCNSPIQSQEETPNTNISNPENHPENAHLTSGLRASMAVLAMTPRALRILSGHHLSRPLYDSGQYDIGGTRPSEVIEHDGLSPHTSLDDALST